MNKDEDLDKIFKDGIKNPVNEVAFRVADWKAMEQMLNKGKRHTVIIYWLPIIGSAAALLLIFLGYLFLKPEILKPINKTQMVVNKPNDDKHKAISKDYTVTPHFHIPTDQKKNNTKIDREPFSKATDNNKKNLTTAKYADKSVYHKHEPTSKSFVILSSGQVHRKNTEEKIKNNMVKPDVENIALNNTTKNHNTDTINKQATIANHIPAKVQSMAANNTVQLDSASLKKGIADANTLTSTPKTTSKIKKENLQKLSKRPQFALSILASSDLNGVNSSFQQSKIGGNFGALFSVSLKKWTISTGATYDIKPYLTSFANYHTIYQFKTSPVSVYANCRMLDIPINLNYQIYSQRLNKITLGTGLSSYFMLREDYKFNYYDAYYSTGPANYTVINKNRNILSVLNLDATYTHQLNSKMGITIQPYLKIPLSNIGASQVRLQTTGMALSLNWNFNKSSKPK